MVSSCARIMLLEEELESVRKERDRFREALVVAENEVVKRKLDFLDLQNDYERERVKRIRLETEGPAPRVGRATASPSVSSSTSTTIEASSLEADSPDQKVAKRGREPQALSPEIIEIDLEDTPEEPDDTIIDHSATHLYSNLPTDFGSINVSSPTLSSHEPVYPPQTPPREPPPLKRISSPGPTPSDIPEFKYEEDTKKKKAPLKLSKIQVSKYLEGAKRLRIFPPPVPVRVSRKALTEKYGMTGQTLLWISEDKTRHFLTPKPDLNPEAPRKPGEPGLLLSNRQEMCKNGPWTLFIQAEGSKLVRYDYAGEYKCRTVGSMTAGEFVGQPLNVKLNWCNTVLTRVKHLVYREWRARMALRKRLGNEPTKEEIDEEAERNRDKAYAHGLTIDDVLGAFERGEERIGIVRLECVSYSHEKARTYAGAQKKSETGVHQGGSLKLLTKAKRSIRKPDAGLVPEVKFEDPPSGPPSPERVSPSPSPSITPLRSTRARKKTYKLLQMEE